MCNCGNKRNELNQSFTQSTGTIISVKHKTDKWKDTIFQYTGMSALTVKGAVTKKRYRFTETGDVLLIDASDVPGMLGIPVLKQVD